MEQRTIHVDLTLTLDDFDGELREVAHAHVRGYGVRGFCTAIGGDTETKAAEAARAAVRKLRAIEGDDLTEELTRKAPAKPPAQEPEPAPLLYLTDIAVR